MHRFKQMFVNCEKPGGRFAVSLSEHNSAQCVLTPGGLFSFTRLLDLSQT